MAACIASNRGVLLNPLEQTLWGPQPLTCCNAISLIRCSWAMMEKTTAHVELDDNEDGDEIDLMILLLVGGCRSSADMLVTGR